MCLGVRFVRIGDVDSLASNACFEPTLTDVLMRNSLWNVTILICKTTTEYQSVENTFRDFAGDWHFCSLDREMQGAGSAAVSNWRFCRCLNREAFLWSK